MASHLTVEQVKQVKAMTEAGYSKDEIREYINTVQTAKPVVKLPQQHD